MIVFFFHFVTEWDSAQSEGVRVSSRTLQQRWGNLPVKPPQAHSATAYCPLLQCGRKPSLSLSLFHIKRQHMMDYAMFLLVFYLESCHRAFIFYFDALCRPLPVLLKRASASHISLCGLLKVMTNNTSMSQCLTPCVQLTLSASPPSKFNKKFYP